jgi:hypothetical protein
MAPSGRVVGAPPAVETAHPGEAAEKSGVLFGYFPPYGESQVLLERHKWPIMSPNGTISGKEYRRDE